MPGEPGAPVPADPAPDRPGQESPAPDRPGQESPAPDRPAVRRRSRRATGGTSSGPEPRLAGLDDPASGAGDGSPDEAHEDWLRAQRPPHWG
ncbi:hypothetical protein [Kocuria sp. SM24M-10]|uniref:hypothetical protein n=1 Tax=Kocuria sp. SM24M-10 TaxID=1660349 RepID=UPI00064A7011|nr:hypothetical protein [Kocuria sp. SM24M-10]KLU11268.1 hypothetical protein ABL57_02140 [Kocuria sp. SM24M-10]